MDRPNSYKNSEHTTKMLKHLSNNQTNVLTAHKFKQTCILCGTWSGLETRQEISVSGSLYCRSEYKFVCIHP